MCQRHLIGEITIIPNKTKHIPKSEFQKGRRARDV